MMTNEKFIVANMKLQEKIKNEICLVQIGESKRNIYQLNTIFAELRKMVTQKSIILNYPRFIIDSWDFADELGLELIDLAEVYKKMK